jgi:hypothetical protein
MTNFALSSWLFLRDDMKLCHPVHGYQDCFKIQIDLNKLAEWCKAKCIRIERRPIEFSNMFGGVILDRCGS